jgi:hypothetical protein
MEKSLSSDIPSWWKVDDDDDDDDDDDEFYVFTACTDN